jgi:hypothetical protein
MEFVPERYLEKGVDGRWKYVPSKVDPRVVIFGYGRRSASAMHFREFTHAERNRYCPGREIAIISMWNTISLTLQLFSIGPKTPNPPPLREHGFDDGMASCVSWFFWSNVNAETNNAPTKQTSC